MKRLRIVKHNFDKWVYNTNIFTFLVWTALVVNVIYVVLFMCVRHFLLAVIYGGEIVYFFSLLNKRDENGRNSGFQMIGMTMCIYISTVLSTLLLGADYSFNSILLSMIPVFFFVEYLLMNSSILSYLSSAVILITDIILVLLNDRFVTKSLTVIEKNIFQSFNWIVSVFFTVFSATVFMAEVFNISSGLTNQNRKLNELANYDPLTQLLLRRPMQEHIDKCVEQKKLYSKDYVICIGDIDLFKKFNDEYGHDCGDVVLKTVSRLIADGVGNGNYVCRWGGEEILILFPDNTVYEAEKVIEKVRVTIEKNIISYKNSNVHVTMTFGISSSEKHIMSHEVIESADKALYKGKQSGRNKVCCG
ncbi:MAG: GGDEF domain-containing protein [Lachnospiraceae bacterium]|nr:GGDEF domain-containing protein [Lachnospiraceae bacterium]MDE6254387.1 GGDEF domain-containing protein [Lachnospiraceae bacterium]